MGRIVEIRTYRLKPGAADEYDRLFVEAAAPLLESAAIDVVAHGPSLGDPDGYVLIRAFDDLGQRDRSEAAFYGSEAWRAGPREQILALIDSYLDVVLELDEATIDGLRQARR
ncbi:MAG: NIPSNAP family protein [Chloroflexi bacterium]|nr:NIPSNAP family protein [Chloroflexota bacterium]